MKELLSIEEKAQRYDEAIERAKNFIENGDESERTIAESIFAGIMEVSKDERIRRVIYGWIYIQPSQFFDNGFSKEEMLNWLEKQSEQIQEIDYSDSLPKDNWELIHEFVNKFGRMPKDEDELNVLIEYVLRRQKPTEWSEENEDTIKFLISHFCVSHCNRSFQFTDNKLITHDELLEKIRNLRPQSTWKPSEEQMKALCDSIPENVKEISEREMLLDSLYQDLKKLRGE